MSREFEPMTETIRQWVKQAALDGGLHSGSLTTGALEWLRRGNPVLCEERQISAKAMVWFSQETGTIPQRRSNSRPTEIRVSSDPAAPIRSPRKML